MSLGEPDYEILMSYLSSFKKKTDKMHFFELGQHEKYILYKF